MTFSIEQLGEIDKVIGQWCLARVPPELKSQIDHDYEIDGQAVTLFEVCAKDRQCVVDLQLRYKVSD